MRQTSTVIGGIEPHGRDTFYKYTTAQTAETILGSASFRWSSPRIFNQVNDPFDVPEEFASGFTPTELLIARRDLYLKLLSRAREIDTSGFNEESRVLIEAAKNVAPRDLPELLSRAKALPMMTPRTEALEEMQAMWRNLRNEMRIICLTDDPVSEYMWLHYAGNFSGIVIEIRCLKLLNSVWFLAEKVNYSDSPKYLTAEGWAESLLYPPKTSLPKIFSEHITTKKTKWISESEYRVTTYSRLNETSGFTDYAFNPFHLESVTYGPRVDQSLRLRLSQFLRLNYPWARIKEAKIGNRQIDILDQGKAKDFRI